MARDPLRLEAIMCIPLSINFSFGSKAKSLKTNSLVVIKAIVTDLLITGGIMSEMALSSA